MSYVIGCQNIEVKDDREKMRAFDDNSKKGLLRYTLAFFSAIFTNIRRGTLLVTFCLLPWTQNGLSIQIFSLSHVTTI